MRLVDREQWEKQCRAVGAAGNTVPPPGHLTDRLIEKVNLAVLIERLEFTDHDGLYLRAGVGRDGSRTWWMRTRIAGTKRRCHYQLGNARTMTLHDARAKANAAKRRAESGQDPEEEGGREAETVRSYLERRYSEKLAGLATGEETKTEIPRVYAALLDKPLAQLTRDDLNSALTAYRATGVRGGTMLKAWNRFKAMLNHAEKNDRLPAGLTRKLTRDLDAMKDCEDAECENWLGKDPTAPRRFAAALAAYETTEPGGSEFIRTAVCLALASGMRRGEITKLTDAMIKTSPDRIELPKEITKSKKGRTVYLTADAMGAIEQWRKVRETLPPVDIRSQPGALFPLLSGYPAEHWNDRLTNGNRDFAEVRKLAKLHLERCTECGRRIHFHSLRHSFGVQLLESCGNIVKVRQAIGHSRTAMTERYAHAIDKTVQEAVQAMPNILTR